MKISQTPQEGLWQVSWRPLRRLIEASGTFHDDLWDAEWRPMRRFTEPSKTPHGGF
ncbi:unnamed protein product [Nesidiocoris tenuis]|uniref:Uncharacterized protein n=1 Tax=Nesidiocoris tenuis TaxID=355587 RepID=A0A6H5HQM3_9HEMI|nr:unnamed protein product [Nesidiocoris tenuis]